MDVNSYARISRGMSVGPMKNQRWEVPVKLDVLLSLNNILYTYNNNKKGWRWVSVKY